MGSMNPRAALAAFLRRLADRLDPAPDHGVRHALMRLRNIAREDVHLEDIKAALRKRKSSLAEVARATNVSRSLVSAVIRRKRSRRVEQAIAKALGTTPGAIWPDRYSKEGRQ